MGQLGVIPGPSRAMEQGSGPRTLDEANLPEQGAAHDWIRSPIDESLTQCASG